MYTPDGDPLAPPPAPPPRRFRGIGAAAGTPPVPPRTLHVCAGMAAGESGLDPKVALEVLEAPPVLRVVPAHRYHGLEAQEVEQESLLEQAAALDLARQAAAQPTPEEPGA